MMEVKVKKQLMGGNGEIVISIGHLRALAHDPDLIDFATYAEAFIHHTYFVNTGPYEIRFFIDGRKEFHAFTESEEISKILYAYFSNMRKYDMDKGYDEETKLFFIVGVNYNE